MARRRIKLLFFALFLLLISACGSNATGLRSESSGLTSPPPAELTVGQTRLFMKTTGTDFDLPLAGAAITTRLLRSDIPVTDLTWSGSDAVQIDISTDDLDRAEALAAAAPLVTFRPVLEELAADADSPALTSDNPSEEAVLAVIGLDGTQAGRLRLGPAILDGAGIAKAEAIDPGDIWAVGLQLKDGAEGIDTFNALAAECFNTSAVCPTGRIAVALDGVILISPTVQTPTFPADGIVVSGNYGEAEARAIAILIDNPELFETFTIERVESR